MVIIKMNKTQKAKSLCSMLALSAVLATPFLAANAGAETLTSAIKEQARTDSASIKSQKKVDGLSEQTLELLSDYKSVLRQTDSLKIYNDQVARMVNSQQKEIDSLNNQISTIDQTNIEITPLMLKMVSTLEEFVVLDLPFQPEERKARVAKLRVMMDRADITTSEKYRKILEAYQIENEFGRTIEAYKGSLGEGDAVRTYSFLRIGRVALLYQSLDGEETGHWNTRKGQFEELPDSYRSAVNQGLKIARKQAPPALIKLPVQAAEEA